MQVIDVDAHVEESPAVFADAYLDPAFRSRRPRVVDVDGMVYWVIEEQLFPRRLGRGCLNLGTPASHQGRPSPHAAKKKADSLASMELRDLGARLAAMDEEGIAVQVVYPTLFLGYPLTSNVPLLTALAASYNRFLGDRLAASPRLKWAATVNLDDVAGAVREVHQAAGLGAVAVMILGTAGDRLLDDPSLFPFYEAVVEEDLALGVHVGWACPSLTNLCTNLSMSLTTAFLLPTLMGFAALLGGGVLDRFPRLRVGFLEAGCQWVHFMVDRLEHRLKTPNNVLGDVLGDTRYKASRPPLDYIHEGNVYFTTEIEDLLLPQVIDLVGESQVLFVSDMPHGDRERFAAGILQARKDIGDAAKTSILETNAARFYGIATSSG